MNNEPKTPPKNAPTLAGQVGVKAARKLKARRNPTPGVWFGLGMMGLIGWSVVVPTLLCAALGSWLASRSALGAIFFGGLWWTIRKAIASGKPALWFLGSLLLRMTVALAGFYFVSGGDLKRMLLCLLGFFMARLLVTRLTKPSADNRSGAPQEANHAT